MAIREAASLLLFVMVMAASDVSCANALNLSLFRGPRPGAGLHSRKFLLKSTGEIRQRILAEKIEPEPTNTYSSRVLAGQLQVGQKISDAAGVDIHDSNYAPRRPRQPIVIHAPPPPSMLDFHTWNGEAHTDYAPVTTHPPVDDDSPPPTTEDFQTWNSKIGNTDTDYPPVTTHPPVDDDSPRPATMEFYTWSSKTENAHTDYAPVTTHPPVDDDHPPPTTMNFQTLNSKVGNVHTDYEPARPHRPIVGHDYP